MRKYFRDLFINLDMPVIVCRKAPGYPLEYANPQALIMINPTLPADTLGREAADITPASHFLRFRSKTTRNNVFRIIREVGSISNYPAEIITYDEKALTVKMFGTLCTLEGRDYFLFILRGEEGQSEMEFTMAMFQASYHTGNMDEAIGDILGLVGAYARVDRAYVFEDLPSGRNTYEWCAEGAPTLQEPQHLRGNEYSYDAIVKSGVFIVDDVREIPEEAGRNTLEKQGIKSLAIFSIYQQNKPLGYVGFDSMKELRRWTPKDTALLKLAADIIESLVLRRNAADQLANTLGALQTISDSNDSIIYVNTMDTYEVVFVNKATRDSLGYAHTSEIIGQKCWQALQKGMSGPCPFCPMPKMRDAQGNILKSSLNWEFQNMSTLKWYMAKDAFIPWIDGQTVHIETATEITQQKAYEAELRQYAATDRMTGAYNREWGMNIITSLRDEANRYTMEISLCFLDLDNLKRVNDQYGHEAGDYLIQETVKTVRRFIRKDDIICRWGGDEFVLLLRCPTAEAKTIMDSILDDMRARNEAKQNLYPLSFSYGITNFLRDERDTVDDIIGWADALMYEHKMRKKRENCD